MEELRGIEWLNWKNNAQTQAFLELLRASVAEAKEEWLNGGYRNTNGQVDIMLNNVALAAAREKQQIISAIEDIKLSDDEESNASEE